MFDGYALLYMWVGLCGLCVPQFSIILYKLYSCLALYKCFANVHI